MRRVLSGGPVLPDDYLILAAITEGRLIEHGWHYADLIWQDGNHVSAWRAYVDVKDELLNKADERQAKDLERKLALSGLGRR